MEKDKILYVKKVSMEEVICVEVVKTDEHDKAYTVTNYFTKDGKLIGETSLKEADIAYKKFLEKLNKKSE